MKTISGSFTTAALSLFVVLVVLFSGATSALALDTGFKFPTATANNVGWASPDNGWTSNNSRATADSDSDIVQYSTFAFPVIPVGATINGIEVVVEGYAVSTGGTDRQTDVSLSWNNGSTYTSGGSGIKQTNLNESNTATDSSFTLGGPTDTWGRTWGVSDFTNANFRIKLDAILANADMSVDSVQVKVYYTPALTQPELTIAKTNNVSGTLAHGGSFTWTLAAANSGTSATFANSSFIVTDSLPVGPTYGTPTVTLGGGSTGTVSCSIVSNDLSCVANGGSVIMPTGGTISIAIPVTPNAAGSLVNPRVANACVVDPANVVVESAEGNNTCSNTVTVTANQKNITAATVNGAASTSATPGAPITVAATLTSTGSGTGNDWRATAWVIANTPPGATSCADTNDFDVSVTNEVETFSANAPLALGTYNLYLIAYESGTCTGSASPLFTLANAVTVEPDVTPPTISVVTPVATPDDVTTPTMVINASEAGTLTYAGTCGVGPCFGGTTSVNAGNNTITLPLMSEGLHSNITITITDFASLSSAPMPVPAFFVDTIDPSGGSVSYTNSVIDPNLPPNGIEVTVVPGGDDAGGTGLASTLLQRRVSVYSGTCAAFSGAWTTISPTLLSATTVILDEDLENNRCYQYQLVVADGSGNSVTYTSGNSAKVVIQHQITVTAGAGGTITPGTGMFNEGSNQAFTVIPNAGFVVLDVSPDGGTQGRVNTFSFNNILTTHTLSATFDGGWSAPTGSASANSVTNINNAFTSNNQSATLDGDTDVVDYTNFGLSIPVGATITGIQVAVEGSTSGRDAIVSLSKNNGAPYTTTQTLNFDGTERTIVAGGLWGTTWTAANFSNVNFRVRLAVDGTTNILSVDQLQVKVSYTPDTTAPAGGSVSYTNGYFTTASVPVTYTLGTDSGAGLDNASGKVERAQAPLSAGSCGTFGPFLSVATEFDGSFTDTTVEGGQCYMYRYVISDLAVPTNTVAYASANVAKVDTVKPVSVINSANDGVNPVLEGGLTTVNDISVVFSATDAHSGVASSQCKLDTAAYAPCTSPVAYNNIADGVHTVSVSSIDAAGNIETTATLTWTIDTSAPIITLTGDASISVEYGVGYSDEGATATDNLDTSLVVVKTGDTVPTNAPAGVYHMYYNVSDDAGNAAPQVERTITVTAKAINVVANAQSKTYGDVDPTLTYVADPLVGGDVFTGSLTRAAGETAGNYAISQGTLSAGTNYTINFTPANFEITSKAITVTVDSGLTKVYGDVDPSLTYTFSPVLVSGDSFTGGLERVAGESVDTYAISQGTLALPASYTITFTGADFEITKKSASVTPNADTKVFGAVDPLLSGSLSGFLPADNVTASYARAVGEAVGSYAISATLAPESVLENYTIGYGTAQFTITPATLTVTADPQTIVYGEAEPAFTFVYAGFQGVDDETDLDTAPTCDVAGANVDVGTYAIVCSGGADTDYAFQYVDSTLTVGQATLSITADNKIKAYGAAVPTLTATYSGFVNGDDASDLDTPATLAATADETSPAGDYVISASGAVDENYVISHTNGTLTVSAVELTITADDKSKTYGDANPSLTATYSGFVNGDDAADLDTPVLLSTLADETSAVGTYEISATGAMDANYTITLVPGTLTISGRAIEITADAQSKSYGGTEPTLTYAVTAGSLVNGDSFTGALIRLPGESVGTYAIQQGTLALPSSYTLTYVGNTLTIGSTNLTVTADAQTKTYGDADPSLTYVVTGLANGDTEAAVISGALTRASGEAVGSYAITQGTLSATGNYNLNFVGANLEVGVRPIQVTADNAGKAYGAAEPALSYQITSGSLAFSDSFSGTISRVAGENAGTYAIGQGTLALDGNYSVSFVDGVFTITSSALNITASSDSMVYGGTVPTITPSYTGFQNGDDANALDTAPVCSTTATNVSAAGTYPSTCSGAVDANYEITYTPGSVTVTASGLEVLIVASDKPYDGTADATVTLSLTGVLPGDDVSVSGGSATFASPDAGSHIVTASGYALGGSDAGNYTISNATAVDAAVISPVNAVIVVTPYSVTYDGNAHTASGSATGVNGADLTSGLDLSATTHTNAGTYAGDAWTFEGGTNYNDASGTVDNSIAQATATITVTGYTGVYDGLPHGATGTATGGNSENLNALLNLGATFTNVPGGTANWTFAGNANYAPASGSVPIVITKSSGSIVITNALDLAIAPTVSGESFQVSWSVTSTGGTPTGNVNVSVNGGAGCSAPVASSSCTLTFPGPTAMVLIATYVGSGNTVGAISGSVPHEVVKADTTITLDGGPATTVGESYMVTWSVAVNAPGSGTPTGTVTVSGGSGCSAAVAVGQCEITSVTAGDVLLVATYSGDSAFNGDVSENATHTVNKAVLTVTADDKSKVYGEIDPAFTSVTTGFVDGVENTVDTVAICDALATHTNAGEYAITCSGAADNNYTFVYVDGTLTITRAISTTTVTCPVSTAYSGSPLTPCTVAITGVNLSLTPDAAYEDNTNVGTASAFYTYDGGTNHASSSDLTTFEIIPAAAVVTLSDLTHSYDGTAKSATVTTNPADLAHTLTYDGSPTAPSAVGSYEVVATITDINYAGTATGTMSIVDNGAPTITVPSDITAEATSASGAAVTFTVTATDAVDGALTATCVPASGDTFPLGTTAVECSVEDAANNGAIATFNVTVEDTTAPVITLNGSSPVSITVGGSYTELGATSLDAVDGSLPAVVGGDTVNTSVEGTYVVSYSKIDAHGNVATPVTRTVVVSAVVEDPAPVLSNEADGSYTTTTATITWTTDHPATSRVVFDTVSHNPVTGVAPNYGYAFSTVEDTTLTTSHSVVVSGLTPSTLYFFRPVSHGSPEAFGIELSGTTDEVVVVLAECADGIDNDNDNATDYPADEGCVNAEDNDETNEIVEPQLGTLIVQKVVDNTDGGDKSADDFSFQIDGGVPAFFENDGTNEYELEAGDYEVNEVSPNTGGYATSYGGDCDSEGNVSVEEGETATCVITNTYGEAVVPPVVNSCPAPDTLGDITVETLGNAPGDESSVQEILDNAGYSLDAQLNQLQTQIWHVESGAEVTIDTAFVSEFAGSNNVFGYYLNGDINTFVALFKTGSVSGYGATPLASAGPFTATIPESSELGFAIKSFNGNTLVGVRATENALSGGSDQVQVYNPSSDKYVLAFEDIVGGDHDFNDLVVDISLSCTLACAADVTTTTVVSDATTLRDGNASAFVSPINVRWTAAIAGATWIWGENPVADPTVDSTEVFTKSFDIIGTPLAASLQIAADNTYMVSVNGNAVCLDVNAGESAPNNYNYQSTGQDTCEIPVEYLVTGENSLVITVLNIGDEDAEGSENPAGLMYKLTVEKNSCVPPPPVCDAGEHLEGNQCVPDSVPVDVCPNDEGVQISVNQCSVETPTDVCPNIEGNQATVPSGMHLESNQCVADSNGGGNGNPAPQGNGGGGGGGNGPIVGSFGGGSIIPTGGQVLGTSTQALPELPAGCSALLNTYMRVGRNSNDTGEVKKLQQFLNDNLQANLPVTGFFGSMTDNAVRKFQVNHTAQVLTPWGISDPTGYVYKTTQRWINLSHCSTLNIPMPDLF